MSDYDGTIYFKDWLPDQPDLGNPGLTEASNMLPCASGFECYRPLNPSGATIPAQVTGAFRAYSNGVGSPIVGTLTNFLSTANNGTTWVTLPTASTIASVTEPWQFAQYEGLVLASRGATGLYYGTAGTISTGTTMTAVAGAPSAAELAVIGQFVVLGNLDSGGAGVESAVQWGPIDNPTATWPTPNSDTATAVQSGIQFLDANFGYVSGLHGGDQFGVILQQMAVTRMTYVGPPAVFSFDRIAEGVGAIHTECSIKAGNVVYFISRNGIYSTDGVSIEYLGEEKTARYLANLYYASASNPTVRTGFDATKNLVYWGISSSSAATSGGYIDHLLIYHILEKRFSHASQVLACFVESGPVGYQPSSSPLQAFSTGNRMGFFDGTPGTATLTTGELEPNAGGYSVIQGIKPLIDQTLNGITVAMGTRNDRISAVSYTAEQTANSRSGFANFRTSARYHRARITITGTFNAAQGLEYQAVSDGFT